jgi:putative tricarboxylic transport membrane protein
MKRSAIEIGVPILWILLSCFIVKGAIDLQIGGLSHPGPGFMPLVIGIFMTIVSFITLLQMILNKIRINSKTMDDKLSFANFNKILIVFISVITYSLVLNYLGYLISTFVLMLFLFKGIAPQKWSIASISTIITVILSYYIFVVWLGCQVSSYPKFLVY